jgi:hypothetical protein
MLMLMLVRVLFVLQWRGALALLARMKLDGVKPDTITFNTAIKYVHTA